MDDLFIFGMGCIVTFVVGCAVGLLTWGAANEPEDVFDSSDEENEVLRDRMPYRAPVRSRIETRNSA